MQEKILSEDPIIKTIDNVLSKAECSHLINISKEHLKDSVVSYVKEEGTHPARVSKNAWLKHDTDDITKNITNRIAKFVGLPIINAEPIQIVEYKEGGEYKSHYDSWIYDNNDEQCLRLVKYGGPRLSTALVYLNDVEDGGETKFTKLDLAIKPSLGKLLIFNNTISSKDHKRHELSEHAGLPVKSGVKYILNLWFRVGPYNVLYKDINPSFYYTNTNSNNKHFDNHNYKLTMNDEWKKWAINNISSNGKEYVKQKLIYQKYHPDLIDKVLNNSSHNSEYKLKVNNYWINFAINNIHTKGTEFIKQKLISENYHPNIINYILRNAILNNSFSEQYLEIGDYLPFIKLADKEVYNIVDGVNIVIITIDNLDDTIYKKLLTLEHKYLYVIYTSTILNNNIIPNNFIKKDTIFDLFAANKIYIFDSNRRVISCENFTIDSKLIIKNIPFTSNIPIIIVENVLNPDLLKRILNFYNNSENREIHDTLTKNRHHVYPDEQLEYLIDNKLSRSLFPEIKKVFYHDVEFREIYKICSYNSESNGRFHAHRDTPFPHQNRKFALSLILNDDYEGGELFLPEYNYKIKGKANTAIVFPGICAHQVLPITSGSRKTIITFFCTEKKNESANIRDIVKSNFYKNKNVKDGLIYPF